MFEVVPQGVSPFEKYLDIGKTFSLAIMTFKGYCDFDKSSNTWVCILDNNLIYVDVATFRNYSQQST